MDTQIRPPSPSQLPASSSKYHHPYFTPAEVDYLCKKQRGKLSETQEEKVRQYACAEMEVIGAKLGLCVTFFYFGRIYEIVFNSPRKTIATAQNLYHRFHLFFPRKDFSYHVSWRYPLLKLLEPCSKAVVLTGRRSCLSLRLHQNARHAQKATRPANGVIRHPVPRKGCENEESPWWRFRDCGCSCEQQR